MDTDGQLANRRGGTLTDAQHNHRLIVQGGKHHNSAVCTVAAVLLTRIAACLRTNTHYQLRDTDGNLITEAQGKAIITQHYTIPPETRAARRQLVTHTRQPRRNERANTGVDERSEAPPAPQPASTLSWLLSRLDTG